MSGLSPRPLIYHITHIDNLQAILTDDGLWSDSVIASRGGPTSTIGMSNIKQRRLGLPVKCHAGDRVGEYVPFYFCPRSIMLYLLHCGNHPDLDYRGGQAPIVHLEADLREAVAWAEGEGRRWAFTLSNAGAYYAEFRKKLEQLDEINWEAVAATDFRSPAIKEGKQAEFLLREFFPWHLVRRVGVLSEALRLQVHRVVSGARHKPAIEIRSNWYY